MRATPSIITIIAAGLLLGGAGCGARHERPAASAPIKPAAEMEVPPIQRLADQRNAAALHVLANNTPKEAAHAQVIRALGQVGDPASLELLMSAAQDADADIAADAIFAMGEILDQNTLTEWGGEPDLSVGSWLQVGLAEEGREHLAEVTIEALGKMGFVQSVPVIREWLAAQPLHLVKEDADALTHPPGTRAMMALARLKDAGSVPVLSAIALNRGIPHRRHALVALFRLGEKSARPTALAALGDPDPRVRGEAARLLGKTGEPEDVRLLLPLLNHAALYPRVQAARGLAMLGGEEAEEGLLKALGAWVRNTEEVPYVAVLAESLGEIGTEASVAPLMELAQRDDMAGYQALVGLGAVLKRTGDEPSMKHLMDMLPFESRGQRLAFLQALASCARWKNVLGAVMGDGLPFASCREDESIGAALQDLYLAVISADPDETTAAHILGMAAYGSRSEVYRRHIERILDAAFTVAEETGTIEKVIRLSLGFFSPDYFSTLTEDQRRSIASTVGPHIALHPQGRAVFEKLLDDPSMLVRREAMKALGPQPAENFAAYLHRPSPARHIEPGLTEEEFYRSVAEDVYRTVQVAMKIEDRGVIVLELATADAPLTSRNFIALAGRGYFDGLSFHRVVPGFVIQGGDPREDMEGGPGYTIPCEVNQRPFRRGALGMALSGKDTGGSQFFLCLEDQPHLDGGYTVFGRLVEPEHALPAIRREFRWQLRGVEVLDRVEQYDRTMVLGVYREQRRPGALMCGRNAREPGTSKQLQEFFRIHARLTECARKGSRLDCLATVNWNRKRSDAPIRLFSPKLDVTSSLARDHKARFRQGAHQLLAGYPREPRHWFSLRVLDG